MSGPPTEPRDGPTRPARGVRAAHTALTLILVAIVGVTVLLPALVATPPFGISSGPQRLLIIDFPSHFNFVKTAWAGSVSAQRLGSAYGVAHHLKITSDWWGGPFAIALPFGYSPTMLWVLAPLVPLSHAMALVWFDLAGLLAAWWQTQPARSRLGLSLIAFLSPIARGGFGIGQTAVLSGAGLLFLQLRSSREHSPPSRRDLVATAFVLWLLTAKPPLAAAAAAVLLGLRLWRPVALASLMSAVSTLLVWPLLGAGWWRDYIQMIANYDTVRAARAFSWSLHPELMANLRGVLNVDLGLPDDVASRASAAVWLVLLVLIVASGPRFRHAPGALWGIGVLSYLAFCPHVSVTEEIKWVLLVPFCVPTDRTRLAAADLVLLVLAALACFAAPAPGTLFAGHRLPLFALKLGALVLLALRARAPRLPSAGPFAAIALSAEGAPS